MKKHEDLRTNHFQEGEDDGIPPSHGQAYTRRVRVICRSEVISRN